MHNIVVFEKAHDMKNGVDVAYIGEEFVAQPFAFRGTSDKSCDVDEFYRRVSDFLRIIHFRKDFKTFVGHGNDSAFCLFGAE